MKILRAKNNIPGKTREFYNVKQLMFMPDMAWLEKRMPDFRKSIEATGMLWPILITDLEHYWHEGAKWPTDENGEYKPGLVCHTGNKRLLWAIENNYDMIEGIFIYNQKEKAQIVSQTFIDKNRWPMEEK